MIYDDDAPASTSRAYHPYSLHEFDPEPASPYKLQWKLQRQQLDEFHHSFWLEVSKMAVPTVSPTKSNFRATLVSNEAKTELYHGCLPRPQP
jgi:hypothetical protein